MGLLGSLLLTTPLEALAETCEAQQSIFNMNMPLLLFVALVGATVGGKIHCAINHSRIWNPENLSGLIVIACNSNMISELQNM